MAEADGNAGRGRSILDDWQRGEEPPRETEACLWPQPIDLERLGETEPQPPAFIISDWLPCGYATLLAGHGGVGKSGIALYLACCIALGRPFFGIPTQQRRVLYLSCEDRENVLHWRLSRIAAHLGIGLATLRGGLDILDLVGHECVLWDPRGHTVAMAELSKRIKTTEREVVFVDGITDTFAGNENAKADVKRYVNALVGLIPADTGSMVLIGHVNRPTAANGASAEGYSGTTAWHNAVRARWYLYPEKQAEDERTGMLLLELQKSNLGRTDQQMRFNWDAQAHLFVGESTEPESHLDRKIREETEVAGVLAALRHAKLSNTVVPAAAQGNRTAFHVLSQSPQFSESLRTGGKPAVRRFWKIIEHLRQRGIILEASHKRPNGHKTACFVESSNIK